jgi:hypothetical protein
MNFEIFEKRVQMIRTLFTQRHCYLVYGLIRQIRPQSVIEIGSFEGYMTAWIARALHDNGDDGLVYAIDNFTLGTSPAILSYNLAALGLAQQLRILDVDSQTLDASQYPPCNLAFIDGDHSFLGVANDVKKCIQAGAEVLILHDTESWWGVNDFKHLVETGSMQLKREISEEEMSYANWVVSEVCGYWGFISVPFDEGLAVLIKRTAYRKPTYSYEDYPKGLCEPN